MQNEVREWEILQIGQHLELLFAGILEQRDLMTESSAGLLHRELTGRWIGRGLCRLIWRPLWLGLRADRDMDVTPKKEKSSKRRGWRGGKEPGKN